MPGARAKASAQAQAVKPAQKNATSNYQTSLTAAKYIASASIHQICYLRDLFPDDTFTNHNIAGLEVKMIDVEHAGVPTEALLVHNLVKEGAFHALKQGCLSKIIFGIAEDMDASIIMEEYMLCFSYNEHGVKVNLDSTTTNNNHHPSSKKTSNNKTPNITTESIKSEMVKIIRSLVATTATLEPVPAERFLFMKLEYLEGTDDSYEPPHFEAAGTRAFGSFRRKPFVLGLGEMKAFNHQMELGVKTVLDGCGHDADQVGGGGGPVMETSRMEENSDSGEEDEEEEEEEEEDDDEMVVEQAKGKRGATSTDNDDAPPPPPSNNNNNTNHPHRSRHHPLEVTAMDLFSEPQYDGMHDSENNNNNNTHPSSHLNSNPNDDSQEDGPSVGGGGGEYTDKEMDAVRSWVLSLQQVYIIDALARFPMITTEAVQLIMDVLQDEEVLAPGKAQNCYKVLQNQNQNQNQKMKDRSSNGSGKNKANTDASLAADLKSKLNVHQSNAPPSNGMKSDDAGIVSGPGSILTQSAVHGIDAPLLDMTMMEEGDGADGGKVQFWPSSQQPESVAGAVKTVKRSFNIEPIHQGKKKVRMSAATTPGTGGGGDGEMKKGMMMVGPATSMMKGKNGERAPAAVASGTGMRVSSRPKRTPASRGGGRK